MKKILWEIFDGLKTIVVFFIVLTLVQRYVFTPVKVDGQSMYSTLYDGDWVIMWELGYEVSAFDVVVFENEKDEFYVKRIIGMPGQSVYYQNDQLNIDGIIYEEPYLGESKEDVANNSLFFWDFSGGLFTEDFTSQEICLIAGLQDCDVIPEGYYLVLGDNRPFSQDSRQIGLVSEEQIMGKVTWIQWPPSRFGVIN